MWINGDLDPWHSASNLKSPGHEQPVVFPVKGAHHCAWMSSRQRGEQASVTRARTMAYRQMAEWLQLDVEQVVELEEEL